MPGAPLLSEPAAAPVIHVDRNDSWNGGTFWQHMGYPVDLSGTERPAFQGSCVVSSVGSQSTSGQTGFVLGHFNDVVPGHSGGPPGGGGTASPGRGSSACKAPRRVRPRPTRPATTGTGADRRFRH